MLALRSRWGTISVALMVLALCLGTQAVSFVTAEEAKSQGDVSEGAEKSSAAADDSAAAADDAADKGSDADAAASDKDDKGKSAKKKASKKREEGARKKKTNTRQPGRDQQKKQTGRGGSIGGVGAAGSSGQGNGNSNSGKPDSSKNSTPADDKSEEPGGGTSSGEDGKSSGRSSDKSPTPAVGEGGPDPKLVEKVMAVQDKHSPALLKQEGIVGTTTALDAKGNVVVKIFTSGAGKPDIPKALDGIPVEVEMRGPIERFNGSAGDPQYDPRVRLPRPIPIGVSGINMTGTCGSLCATGTIGCRLKAKDGSGYYALSNNHVFALENAAPLNSPIVQPGPLDNSCLCVSADDVGKLFKFKSLNLDLTGFNVIDAAIIKTDENLISNKTLPDGYGVPRTYTYRKPFLGQSVMKYGRTTGFTKGRIVGINTFSIVSYGAAGIGLFRGQITVRGINGNPFGNPGDSGSLVVDKDRFPLGLLFAGGGGFVDLNPIQAVLDEFGMEIDGDDALDFDPPGKVGKSQPNRPK